MECPSCEQDYLVRFSVARTGEWGLVCPECDALWLANSVLPPPGYTRRGVYVEERGLGPDEFVFGPSTGDAAPPVGVRLIGRLSSRTPKIAPHEPPWGEVGGVLCPYCEGNLIEAELPPGVRFSFCSDCEQLWPEGAPLTQISPTWLAQFLDDHHATWDDVVWLGRRREA